MSTPLRAQHRNFTIPAMKLIEGLTAEEERAAAIFRALGNPARVRIITELARRNACVTGDLVDVLPLAQSTVSQHLKVLKEAGIIRGSIGGEGCYCLDPDVVRWLANFCTDVCCPPEASCAPGGGASPGG
ncbi:MAG: transcriptional regulator [Anaerolinea sp.]|nr:transcriptional regulator [Anaerolinea sp.]